MKKKIGFLGCGNIGSAVSRLLSERAGALEKNEGVGFEITACLVRDTSKNRNTPLDASCFTTDPARVLDDPEIEIVMEFMGGEQPAAEYMARALKNGKSVVTANKMALAQHWQELVAAARKSGAGLFFEASVCGAIPIIRVLNDSFQANKISSVMGIINGTTNYILTRMSREGAEYSDVLKDAQRLGLAEPDPTADVEGYDAMYKLSILSTLAFHRHVLPEQLYREGISGITPLDIQFGREFGLVLKLLAIAKEKDGIVECRVHPAFVPETHPLASVSDAFNAVFVEGRASGEMMFYGRGAGDMPTAGALVSDLVKAGRGEGEMLSAATGCSVAQDWDCVHFIRMRVKDRPGVLAQICTAFAQYEVSIASMVQKGNRDEENCVQLVILTHTASEHAVREALNRLDESVTEIRMIRVEGME